MTASTRHMLFGSSRILHGHASFPRTQLHVSNIKLQVNRINRRKRIIFADGKSMCNMRMDSERLPQPLIVSQEKRFIKIIEQLPAISSETNIFLIRSRQLVEMHTKRRTCFHCGVKHYSEKITCYKCFIKSVMSRPVPTGFYSK